MKALSVRQPWAGLLGLGIKPVENRTLATSYRGPLAIHASLTWDMEGAHVAQRILNGVYGADTPFQDACLLRGGLVAEVHVTDCVTDMRTPWFFGPHGFVAQGARVTPFRACAGKQGFFDVPDVGEDMRRETPAPDGSTIVTEPYPDLLRHLGGVVYVDPLRGYPEAAMDAETRRNGELWCHLWCVPGDEALLHRFAGAIGLRREWFQDMSGAPHYDLVPRRRRWAVAAGAIETTWKDFSKARMALLPAPTFAKG